MHTAVGEVRAVDAQSATITIMLAQGKAREHTRRGRALTLRAAPAQLAAARMGEIVEFHYRDDVPYPRLVSINPHTHRETRGLPIDVGR